MRAAAAALITPQEKGEVEKPSGAIRPGSGCEQRRQLQVRAGPALAVDVSGGSGTGSGCERDWSQQRTRQPNNLLDILLDILLDEAEAARVEASCRACEGGGTPPQL
ncbi:hypothetical protein MDA_GLEAN10018097 [Myotis davidii]|uniref:Uncharacterized protein n=1 Tax=Myotis davidii TaxID=225400 RepID=L5LG97_MYODS|nr:hypothetical protein MDA_GLEAN10018097 [Myotis davidii]